MAGGAVRGEESGGGRGDGWSSGQDLLLYVVYLVKQQGKTIIKDVTDFSVFESKKISIFFSVFQNNRS